MLLPYLEKDVDDGMFLDLMMLELYHKLYPLIQAEFRHKGDCTICHAGLTGNKGMPIMSTGAERLVVSPESISSLGVHAGADLAFNASYTTAKVLSELKVGKPKKPGL